MAFYHVTLPPPLELVLCRLFLLDEEVAPLPAGEGGVGTGAHMSWMARILIATASLHFQHL